MSTDVWNRHLIRSYGRFVCASSICLVSTLFPLISYHISTTRPAKARKEPTFAILCTATVPASFAHNDYLYLRVVSTVYLPPILTLFVHSLTCRLLSLSLSRPFRELVTVYSSAINSITYIFHHHQHTFHPNTITKRLTHPPDRKHESQVPDSGDCETPNQR